MITDDLTTPAAAACATLIAQINHLSDEIKIAEAQVAQKRGQLTALRSAVEALLPAVSESERARLPLGHLPANVEPPKRITPEARAVIEKLKSDMQKTWKVEELQKHLEVSRVSVSDRYASNLLGKLHEHGLLTRVGRGLYRANDTLLAIEGLVEDDYD